MFAGNSPTTACERHMVYIDEWGSGWNVVGNAFVGAGEETGFFFSHDGRSISKSYVAPLVIKMAQNLDLRCVLVPAPWVLGPKHVSNPE